MEQSIKRPQRIVLFTNNLQMHPLQSVSDECANHLSNWTVRI